MDTLAPGEQDATRRMSPLAQVVLRALDLIEVDPSHGAHLADSQVGPAPVTTVAPPGLEGQGLKPPAAGQPAG